MLRGLSIPLAAALAACGNPGGSGGARDADAEVREASEAAAAPAVGRRGGVARPAPPVVGAMIAEIDPGRLRADLERLVGFGTRHALSDVGPMTEARLPDSEDDRRFAVRAYDQAGYRCPAAFPRVARE
ncbi:MAG TPA: hypothetical protein VIK91_04495 [Nannocystis sp.]